MKTLKTIGTIFGWVALTFLVVNFSIVLFRVYKAGAATDIVNDGTLSVNLISCWELNETSGTRVDACIEVDSGNLSYFELKSR